MVARWPSTPAPTSARGHMMWGATAARVFCRSVRCVACRGAFLAVLGRRVRPGRRPRHSAPPLTTRGNPLLTTLSTRESLRRGPNRPFMDAKRRAQSACSLVPSPCSPFPARLFPGPPFACPAGGPRGQKVPDATPGRVQPICPHEGGGPHRADDPRGGVRPAPRRPVFSSPAGGKKRRKEKKKNAPVLPCV